VLASDTGAGIYSLFVLILYHLYMIHKNRKIRKHIFYRYQP